jgi:hypothetical protein
MKALEVERIHYAMDGQPPPADWRKVSREEFEAVLKACDWRRDRYLTWNQYWLKPLFDERLVIGIAKVDLTEFYLPT